MILILMGGLGAVAGFGVWLGFNALGWKGESSAFVASALGQWIGVSIIAYLDRKK